MTDINPILPEITVIVRALHSKQKAESGRIGLKKKKIQLYAVSRRHTLIQRFK